MTLDGFLRLALQTVTAPRDVARLLLSLRLPQEALILGFFLAIVANAAVFALGLVISPPPPDMGLLASPVALMVMQAVVLLALMAVITWLGQVFGGIGQFRDVAVLMIWLQALRVLAQLVLVVLMPLAPSAATLLVVAATAIGAYVTVIFIDEAHGLENVFKAVFVLIFGMLAMAIVLSILLGLAGFEATGVANHV